MINGQVDIIKENTAVGNNPTKPEFSNYLYSKGIREIIYTDVSDNPRDKKFAVDANLKWNYIPLEQLDIKIFESGGTYYIYGSAPDLIKNKILNK